MKIVEPQSASLTNVEVLAFLSANPPRRPGPPPGVKAKYWIPKPDLRDHNTVVKEIHNYIQRLSPHLLRYPRYLPEESSKNTGTGTENNNNVIGEDATVTPGPVSMSKEPTPLDLALRELIRRLKPYKLTKGEVLMVVNLGIGLDREGDEVEAAGNGPVGDYADGEGAKENGYPEEGNAGEGEVDTHRDGDHLDVEASEAGEEDIESDAVVMMDAIIEQRTDRLTNEDVLAILSIVREVLGGG